MPQRTCSVPACQSPVSARGWCNKHYLKWRRYGHPEVYAEIQGDNETRFWSKVIAPADPFACWEWTDACDKDGYGKFRLGAKNKRAHRVAWEMMRGDIPDDPTTGKPLVLDHECRNRSCVNPWHLDPVTNGVNVRRGNALSDETCRRGHPRTAENTGKPRNGRRYCKDCKAEDYPRHPRPRQIACLRGHRLDPPNLVLSAQARGQRTCLACHRALTQRWNARKRGRDFDVQAYADIQYERIMDAA